MAQNSANILAGPARIFLGVYGTAVAPVTGTPPTLFQHTAGVPSGLQTGYTEVGYTTGPCTFDYKAVKTDIIAEQSLMIADAFVAAETVQVQFTCYERVAVALRAAFDNVGNTLDATGQFFYGGGGQTIVNPLYWTVFFSSIHRDNSAKYSWGCLYKTYSVEGIKQAFEKAKPTSWLVTMKAIADKTRSAGDEGFQLKHES